MTKHISWYISRGLSLTPCGYKKWLRVRHCKKSVFMSNICYEYVTSQCWIYQYWINKINKIKYEITFSKFLSWWRYHCYHSWFNLSSLYKRVFASYCTHHINPRRYEFYGDKTFWFWSWVTQLLGNRGLKMMILQIKWYYTRKNCVMTDTHDEADLRRIFFQKIW